jgi:glycosyltransferase involved in cell wall biosynthesis
MTITAISTGKAQRRNRAPKPFFTPGPEQVSIGFVSTYPPTRCGLATFTASLAEALAGLHLLFDSGRDGSTSTGIVRCVTEPGLTPYTPGVVAEWVRNSRGSLEAAARVLNTFDSVIVQHEFGVFGGQDGAEILDLVELLDVPVIVVLHTVLPLPSPHQREIVEQLARSAHRLVAQSVVARERLLEAHDVDPARVVVIQHGATANIAPPRALPADPDRRPVILTWGLLGPGKGIEYAIDAVAQLRDLDPLPRYVVVGETHPNIVRESGEAYRESLVARAQALGIAELIEFDNGYRDTAAILAEIRKADIVLLPYLSREQVVSGVLVEAIASAKPVVSTAFPHAVELLGEGSGIVVPHEDPDAMARALRVLLTDHERAAQAAAVARRQAPSLTWEHVARSYLRIALDVAPRRLNQTAGTLSKASS